MNSYFKNKYLLIVIFVIMLSALIGIVYRGLFIDKSKESPIAETPFENDQMQQATTTPLQASGLKTYRNEEFGFELQYPEEWLLRTDIFYSRHSFFNLAGGPPEKEGMLYAPLPPFFVNVATPDFADKAFYILKNTASETKVDGVVGLRYKYETEWVSSVTIVLPFRQYRVILGATKEYEYAFNQILTSFHFLKSTIQTPGSLKVKTYRNEEWGFEFQYPEEVWIFRTNTFSSPHSKFHLIGAPLDKEGLIFAPNPPFVINIVTPDFAERSFYDLKDTASETKVDGVVGLRYEYEYQGHPEMAIILPFGQYKLILGANKTYGDVFNQVISTFKFLK